MQSPIFAANFTNNMSRSGWTWYNLWNLLINNFKYKYFHNSVDWSGLYLQVYIPSWLPKNSRLYTVFRLLQNAFMKLPHPWHDLIINPPCRTAHQKKKKEKNCPPSSMKSIYKKVTPCFLGGDTMPLLHWKIMWGYILPQYLQGSAY